MAGDTTSFIDTNILIYAHDRTDIRKQQTARAVLEAHWERRSGALSTQVLQEFYAAATRKLPSPIARNEARQIVSVYSAWQVVTVDTSLMVAASHLEESEQLSFWDALIIESARVAGADRLLTEDLQDGRVIKGVRIENPFLR